MPRQYITTFGFIDEDTSTSRQYIVTGANIGGYIFDNPVAAAATGLIKVWSGSAWNYKPVKVWTGSAWVQKPVKFWNGSSWVQK